MKLSPSIVLALTATCGLVISSRAGIVVNDTWNDGTRTDPASPTYSEQGTDSDADGNIESAWFKGGGGTLTPNAGTPGNMVGTGIGTSSASWYTYFTQPATPIVLANPGDTLRLTWAFTPTGVNTNNTSQGFNVALANTVNSSSRVTGDASVPTAVYASYAMFMNMGNTYSNANAFQLREWNLGATAGALLGTSGNYTSLTNGSTIGNHGYDDGIQYTLQMTLTRGGAGDLLITSTMSGGTLNGTGSQTVVFDDTTPNTFTYDTFDIRPSNTAQTAGTITFNQFEVETYNVPEPSSVALLGLAAIGIAARRLRRSSH
jgi:hypothetical protein